MAALHDMHCHLDFMANGEEVAQSARDAGALVFANTVTPDGWAKAHERFGGFDNVVLGIGLHPWWVEAPHDVDCILELLGSRDERFIGEIGLDLGRRHAESADLQADSFRRIAQWAADCGDKVISIHSVHAARETLDILEKTGAAQSCACIFHWFSGPSDQLKRAVTMGCYFSFGTRALATGKGREYVKAVPVGRLLLETDNPPDEGRTCAFDDLQADLEAAMAGIEAIKGTDARTVIAQTSAELLSR